MTNCNDFRTFKKEKGRMCDFFENNVELCPLKIYHSGWNCLECDECCLVRIDFAIKTVQEWSDRHPTKTRQSEFLKMFPDARVRYWNDSCLVLDICPRELDKYFSCKKSLFCADCQHNYWLEVVE